MTKKIKKLNNSQKLVELLQDLLILELGKAKVSQHEIRKVLGVDIHKVNRIVKYLQRK